MSLFPIPSANSAVDQDPARPSFISEWGQTGLLAFPLIAGQLGQMLMAVIDTAMVGRLGVTALGAVTFANTLISVPFVFGLGLLSCVSVRVSQAHGAGDRQAAREAVRHGTWLAAAFAAVVIGLTLLGLPLLGLLGQPPEITAASPKFLVLLAFSVLPAMLSTVWKNHGDALHQPWPPFFILLGGVGLNALLNWAWIYGNAGFPALGIEGAALATLCSRILVAAGTLLWLLNSRRLQEWSPLSWFEPCRVKVLKRLLAIGAPVSLQLLTEVSAFAAASLLIGRLGAVPLAAHQVAITCAATTFMVPLGINMALTVRIGRLAGARQTFRMRRVLLGGWLYSLLFMSVSMGAFLYAGDWIAARFIDDSAVVLIARKLLVVAGLFQLFDGFQVVSAGALRGVDDVRIPAWITLCAYWAVALPAGAWLGLWQGRGATGVWEGLALGLAFAAVSLGARAWKRLQ